VLAANKMDLNCMTSQIIATGLTKHFCTSILIFHLLSCSNTSKLVCKTKADGNRIRFFQTSLTKSKKNLGDFYAQVDSDNVRIYYSFFSNDINKTYDNDDNVRYILTSSKQPMSPLTTIDRLVLTKADRLMDSLNYKDLKRTKGATGYDIEVLRTPL
jgi:hypothetical protein